MTKFDEPRVSREDGKKPFVVISIAVILSVLAIVVLSQHLIESLTDNSAKLRKFHVTPKSVSDSPMIDVMDFGDRREAASRRYGESFKFYERGMGLRDKNPKDAIPLLEKAARLYVSAVGPVPKDGDERFTLCYRYYFLAECYYRIGKYKEALQTISVACHARGDAGQIRLRSAIYRKMGDTAKADADGKLAKQIEQNSNGALELEEAIKTSY